MSILDEDHTDSVWFATVDDQQWACEVTQTGDYTGQLKVTRVSDDQVILDEQVGLSYGAMFGPDVADVADWQERCITAIDAVNATTEGGTT